MPKGASQPQSHGVNQPLPALQLLRTAATSDFPSLPPLFSFSCAGSPTWTAVALLVTRMRFLRDRRPFVRRQNHSLQQLWEIDLSTLCSTVSVPSVAIINSEKEERMFWKLLLMPSADPSSNTYVRRCFFFSLSLLFLRNWKWTRPASLV